ncbi:MAG: hypothetical protein IPM16_01885 [Chloroflexi bacterium]|nr:hypothetical protein [Chloroflexota bacterium]
MPDHSTDTDQRDEISSRIDALAVRAGQWLMAVDLRVVGVLLAALVAFLFSYRQHVYPPPDFDEGAYINVARTFAEEGIYAEKNSDGYNFLGPVISTGPTVILPIAALFKVVEPSLPAARLVIALYGFVMMASLMLLCLRLMTPRAAVLVILLALFGWGNLMPYLFRIVLGEGPGLALLFAGLLIWLTDNPGRARLIAAGVLFGFVSITKMQYAFFVLPSLLVLWIANVVWYRQRRWDYFVIPGVVAGAIFFGWTYFTYFVNGSGMRDPVADWETVRATAGSAYFVFDPLNKIQNVYWLTNGLTLGGLFIPGLLYGLWRSTGRTRDGLTWGTVTTMFVFSSLFFVLSTGWPRIGIPTKMIATIFAGALAVDAFTAIVRAGGNMQKSGAAPALSLRWIAVMLALGWLTITIVLPSLRAFYYVVRLGDDSAYRVGAYLDEVADVGAVVETWDRELGVISRHNYHFPPISVDTQFNSYENSQTDVPARDVYDFRDVVDPGFVVVGPRSRDGDLYDSERLSNYVLVETFGAYKIFEKRPAP